MFVVRSLKVLNWESLLAIEQIVESKKTMKSIHTSWTIAFGNALIPFLSFFFFSRTCKKKQIPFLNGRGRGGTEQNKIPLYLSLGLCAFLNLSWVGLRRRVPREISSSSPKEKKACRKLLILPRAVLAIDLSAKDKKAGSGNSKHRDNPGSSKESSIPL